MEFDIVKKGKYLLGISLVLLVIGTILLLTVGLKFGIDFTGGTVLTYTGSATYSNSQIERGIDLKTYIPFEILQTSQKTYTITTKPLSQSELLKLEQTLNSTFKVNAPTSVNAIGPVIGNELKSDAIKAIIIASLAIIMYIAWAFRRVPKPVSSWTFGITAVLAMAHDVLIVLGAYALACYFFGARVDSLFVTGILTVIGFSVHDTIVVFDRIRENLTKNPTAPFHEIVNNSLLETLARSVNTSLTVILTLLSLFLLGGESIRWFVFTLLIGITSGTYSSIFVATQLLVLYQNFKMRKGGKLNIPAFLTHLPKRNNAW